LCNLLTLDSSYKTSSMRNSFLTSLTFLLFNFTNAQKLVIPLGFQEPVINMSVCKDEAVCFISRKGEVAITRGLDKFWSRTYPDTSKRISSTSLGNVIFFNQDTGLLSGYINGEFSGRDLIYHTTDGGKSWKEIKIGQYGWVDNAVNLDNGEAWLSVEASGIAYSSDYGMNWKKIKTPSTKERYTEIFFNKSHQGILGSLWNKLIYTSNNGKKWISLPTPLDQNKYNKINLKSRPQFENVAIYEHYFLVKQEGMIFYSDIEKIEWKQLPNYDNFYTDGENTALYFRFKRGGYTQSDNNFGPLKKFEIHSLSINEKCKNGNLYILTYDGLLKLTAEQELSSFSIKSNRETKNLPIWIGHTSQGTIGYIKNKIYRQDRYDGPWTYIATLPIKTDTGILYITNEQKLHYQDLKDSLIVMDLSGNILDRKSSSGAIKDFAKSDITKIKFIRGSRGHMFLNEEAIVYTLQGSIFSNSTIEGTGQYRNIVFPEYPEIISYEEVQSFLEYLPKLFSYEHLTTIDELGFTQNDYTKLKNDILIFKQYIETANKKEKEPDFVFYKNNLDFNKLLRLVDNLPTTPPEILNICFSNNDFVFNDTTNWTIFQCINSKNEILNISYHDYYNNGILLPWVLNLNGQNTQCSDFAINRFLNTVYPEFVEMKNNYRILYKLIKEIYEMSDQ